MLICFHIKQTTRWKQYFILILWRGIIHWIFPLDISSANQNHDNKKIPHLKNVYEQFHLHSCSKTQLSETRAFTVWVYKSANLRLWWIFGIWVNRYANTEMQSYVWGGLETVPPPESTDVFILTPTLDVAHTWSQLLKYHIYGILIDNVCCLGTSNGNEYF